MPIDWCEATQVNGEERIPVQIHSTRAGGEDIIRLLGPAVVANLHYAQVPAPGNTPPWRSLPCLRAECILCPLPKCRKGYAPALLWTGPPHEGRGGWVRVAQELPDSVRELWEGNHRGEVWRIKRPGKHRNGKLQAVVFERPIVSEAGPSFDVRPILLRCWSVGYAYLGVRLNQCAMDPPPTGAVLPLNRPGSSPAPGQRRRPTEA